MYCNQTPPPADSASAKLTLKFLEACNKIFERGLLSHDKVTSPDSRVVTNITEGFKFFSTWLDGIYAEGLMLNNCNATMVIVCTQILHFVQLKTAKRNFFHGKVRNVLGASVINFSLISAWDNLRIDVYGFTELTKYFLECYPGYFLSPLRVSGSAVESLFG